VFVILNTVSVKVKPVPAEYTVVAENWSNVKLVVPNIIVPVVPRTNDLPALTVPDVTGVSAVGVVGTVTASGGAIVNLTGVYAVGQIGNVETKGSATVNLTGVYAVGRIGNVTASGSATVNVTGVSTIVKLNTVNVWGLINPVQTPDWVVINDAPNPNWTDVIAA